MHRTLLTAGAALLALTAFPATAQVVGDIGGQVTGQVGGQVATPPLGSTIDRTGDLTRETVRDNARITRDTADDAREALGHTPEVDAGVSADAGVNASSGSADLDVGAGAMVHASDGALLGHVVTVTRDAAGRAQSLAVRTADGAVRTVPAAGASVEGSAVVTAMTEAEFEALPQ